MARHKILGVTFAIKELHKIFEDPYLTKSALREIEIMRQLTMMANNHHTVKLFDIIVPEGDFTSVYLVLEYHPLILDQVLRQDGVDFSLTNALGLFYNLLCGVNYIHSAGIMHRDLKPDNILVSNSCEPIICDFGMARSVSEDLNGLELGEI
jgi:serine/threonine protein kinase